MFVYLCFVVFLYARPSSPIVHMRVCNNVMVVALSSNTLTRIDMDTQSTGRHVNRIVG